MKWVVYIVCAVIGAFLVSACSIGMVYAADAMESGAVSTEGAIVGVLGLNAISTLFAAFFGGKGGSKGIMERVAILETKVEHITFGVDDLKEFMGCGRRSNEKKY